MPGGTPYVLSAILIDTTAVSTVIAGSYFGFDQTGSIVPLAYSWVLDMGASSTIGIQHTYSNLPLAKHQRNIFSQYTMVTCRGTNTVVSGNWFGYNYDGTATRYSPYIVPGTSRAIDMLGTQVIVGTNEDSSGDSVEGNWFSCLLPVTLNSKAARIAGNFFGFERGGQTNSSASYATNCTTGVYILSSSDDVIGVILFGVF